MQHQVRDVDAVGSGCSTSTPCREQASGRLAVQKESGTRRAPSIRWKALAAPATPRKATAPPHAAAILERMRELLGLHAMDSTGSVSASVRKSSIGSVSALAKKPERLEGLVVDPQNSHRDTMDRRADYLRSIARRIAACFSPGVLSNRALCL